MQRRKSMDLSSDEKDEKHEFKRPSSLWRQPPPVSMDETCTMDGVQQTNALVRFLNDPVVLARARELMTEEGYRQLLESAENLSTPRPRAMS